MLQTLIRRLARIPFILLAVHFAGFTYAQFALQVQKAANPWGSAVSDPPPVLNAYFQLLQSWGNGDFGKLPVTEEPISTVLSAAALTALGCWPWPLG